MENLNKITKDIELCLIPKLNKNFDECEYHVEFDIRNKNIDEHFQIILNILEEINLKESCVMSEHIISLILILYYELLSHCSWNNEKCIKLSKKLNGYFEVMYEVSLNCVLLNNKVFNQQTIFDKCLENLHSKLTSDGFKRYPGQIEVYHNIVKNVKTFKVAVVPSKVLPASLHLIDDYIIENKVKGLQCCISVLQCLNEQDFQEGNYYEVVYMSLKKVVYEKNIEVTKLVFQCLMNLYNVLPARVKPKKLDDIYVCVLDQLYVESNLYRKAECMNFIKEIIAIHKIHCANRSVFQTIIADNLELCCNAAAAEVILNNILLMLKEWIRHCWCIWQLSTGHKILSNLFKILYLCKEDNLATEIQNLIVTLIRLCNDVDKNIFLII